MDLKLTQVVSTLDKLSDRQDRIEASLEQLNSRCTITFQRPEWTHSQMPPRQPVTIAACGKSTAALLQTSAFESPSMLWYDNPPSFIDDIQPDGNVTDYMDHASLMKIRTCNSSASRKHFSSLIVRATVGAKIKLT